MAGVTVAVSLTVIGFIALSWSTLTWAAPWATLTILLAGLYAVGKQAAEREALDPLARRICARLPALRRLP